VPQEACPGIEVLSAAGTGPDAKLLVLVVPFGEAAAGHCSIAPRVRQWKPMLRFRPVPGECGALRAQGRQLVGGTIAESQGATEQILVISTEKMVTVTADKRDSAQEEGWIGQLNLIYVGLIVVGVYMVQPFLTAASLDVSARISVVAFSVAIPLLAALVLVNQQEPFGVV
jgi:hypothetical protein